MQSAQDLLQNFERLVIFVHDGVYSLETGAGVSNARLLQCLVTLGSGARLHIGAIETAISNPDYHAGWFNRVETLVRGSGGRISPVRNGSRGSIRYGTVREWRIASHFAERLIARICKGRRTLVLSFDSPYIGLMKRLAFDSNIIHVHTPRSTGALHEPRNTARREFEAECLATAERCEYSFVGCTGDFMFSHLVTEFSVPTSKLRMLRNGVLLNSDNSEFDSAPGAGGDPTGIPPTGPFVLAFGRAVSYKGFHVLLEALSLLGHTAPSCVLIATESGGDQKYLHYLRSLWRQHRVAGSFLTRFDYHLPRRLQQSPHLVATVVPSLSEPFGLIPIESFANESCDAPVIASATQGLVEQVRDGITGFTFTPGNARQLAELLREVQTMDADARRVMKERGMSLVRARFDYLQNVRGFLSEFSAIQ